MKWYRLSGSRMSEIREIEFFCPHCRARNKAALHTRVDARIEPEVAAQLLNGSLSDVNCWQCREQTPLEHSLVYVDEGVGGAIWLDPPKDPLAVGEPPIENLSKMRRVRDANAVRELASIWRDGLDDAAMLLLKHMLAARMLEETGFAPILCAYEDRFNMDGKEWLEYVIFTSEDGDPESLTTPVSTYKSVAEAVEQQRDAVFPVGQWADWDDGAAQQIWERMKQA